jgi:Ala-tRNA(Pro) deacylase
VKIPPARWQLRNVQAIAEFLDGARIRCELVEHEPAMSGAREALVTHQPPDQVAKTLVLHHGAACAVAAIPASERLDLHKLRELLGATRHLRLASEDEIANEDEIASDFRSFDVGAIPPFGPTVPAAEVIDPALLEQDQILWADGDHCHSVWVGPREIVRITAAKTPDIRQD